MATIIDTPQGIAAFRMLQLVHALALEINTGMKLSRVANIMVAAAQRGYAGPSRGTKVNKVAALKWAVEQMGADYVPSSTVTRALAA
jgi:hypothetical protein